MIPNSVRRLKIFITAAFLYCFFVTLYALSNRASTQDYIFLTIIEAVLIFATWFGVIAGLIFSLVGIFVYGGYFFFQSFVWELRHDIGTKEAIWIMLIPTAGILAGYLGEAGYFVVRFFDKYRQQAESLIVTGQMGMVGDEMSFHSGLREECSRAHRSLSNFSMALLDVANVSELQTILGVDAIEQASQKVAEVICSNTRDIDKKAKLGDTRYGLIIPDASREKFFVVLDRIRRDLQNAGIEYRGRMIHTKIDLVSGLALYPEGGSTSDKLLQTAQKELQDSVRYYAYEKQGNGHEKPKESKNSKESKNKKKANGAE
jgi:diguanylate cyclase (GGDEF)-like protein